MLTLTKPLPITEPKAIKTLDVISIRDFNEEPTFEILLADGDGGQYTIRVGNDAGIGVAESVNGLDKIEVTKLTNGYKSFAAALGSTKDKDGGALQWLVDNGFLPAGTIT